MGAKLNIITCLEDYSLPEGEVEFVCGSDGSWSLDPSDYQCTLRLSSTEMFLIIMPMHERISFSTAFIS